MTDAEHVADAAPDRESVGPPNGRAPWLGALALAIAFAGGFGVAGLVSDPSAATAPASPSPTLFADLDLTPEQRAVVDSVLSATRASTARTLEETRMELTAQAVDAIRAIEAVLQPAQIEILKARMDARKAGTGSNAAGEATATN